MDFIDKGTTHENTNVLIIYEILRKIWRKSFKLKEMRSNGAIFLMYLNPVN